MRPPFSLLIICGWALAAGAQAQTAVTSQPVATGPRVSQTAVAGQPAVRHAARAGAIERPDPSKRPRFGRRGARPVAAARPRRGSPGADGQVSLGATDITGNKELPKVMVIVPWKSPTGADGVMPPTDSLMSEVLQPVDRGVFQRRIRYYGQLNRAAGPLPATHVAPVGDSR